MVACYNARVFPLPYYALAYKNNRKPSPTGVGVCARDGPDQAWI